MCAAIALTKDMGCEGSASGGLASMITVCYLVPVYCSAASVPLTLSLQPRDTLLSNRCLIPASPCTTCCAAVPQDPSQPNNLAATLLNVQAGRCQPLPHGISAGCREVISGLLCPDPTRRTRLEVRHGHTHSHWCSNNLRQKPLVCVSNARGQGFGAAVPKPHQAYLS
jgi:hypothetical protein